MRGNERFDFNDACALAMTGVPMRHVKMPAGSFIKRAGRLGQTYLGYYKQGELLCRFVPTTIDKAATWRRRQKVAPSDTYGRNA